MKECNEKSKYIKFVLMGAIIIAIIVCALLFFISKGKSYINIQIMETMGTTNVFRDDVSLVAYKGMNLKNGDDVVVNSASSMHMKLDESQFVHAQENTEFQVVASGGRNSRKVKIELAEGDILIEIQKKLGENESFEVSTPNALMAVRGTVFSVSVHINEEGKHEIHLVVLDGVVEVKSYDGTVQAIPAGQEFIFDGADYYVKEFDFIDVSEQIYNCLHGTCFGHDTVVNKNLIPSQALESEIVPNEMINPFTTPSPTTAPALTEIPELTETPGLTEMPESTVTPGLTEMPKPTVTPGLTEMPEPTVTPILTVMPELTVTPILTMMPESTVTPGLTEIPEPTVTPVLTEMPEPTATPTNTPSPTPTEVPLNETPASAFRYSVNSGKVTIEGLKDLSLEQVYIPTKIEGYPVTKIADSAFYECENIIILGIPDSVVSIGESAFELCTGLQSIKLSSNISSIANRTFWGCRSLMIIELPDNVTSIGDEAFTECNSLLSIRIPSKVMSIPWGAFYGCYSMRSIDLPDGVTSIAPWAFSYTGLESIVIPAGVSMIETSVFQSCYGLTNVEIPDSVTEIADGAFRHCISLEYVELPSTLSILSSAVFEGCSSLKRITIPETVTDIYDKVFADCTSLSEVKLPEGLIVIQENSFNGCSSLGAVVLPPNISYLGNNPFSGCGATLYVQKASLTEYILLGQGYLHYQYVE